MSRVITVYVYLPISGKGGAYGATSDTLDAYALAEIRQQGRLVFETEVEIPE